MKPPTAEVTHVIRSIKHLLNLPSAGSIKATRGSLGSCWVTIRTMLFIWQR